MNDTTADKSITLLDKLVVGLFAFVLVLFGALVVYRSAGMLEAPHRF